MALELEFYSLCSIRIFLLPFSIAFSPLTHFRPHITYAPFQILLRLIIIYFRFLIICYRLWAKNEKKKKTTHTIHLERDCLISQKQNITKIKSTSYNMQTNLKKRKNNENLQIFGYSLHFFPSFEDNAFIKKGAVKWKSRQALWMAMYLCATLVNLRSLLLFWASFSKSFPNIWLSETLETTFFSANKQKLCIFFLFFHMFVSLIF